MGCSLISGPERTRLESRLAGARSDGARRGVAPAAPAAAAAASCTRADALAGDPLLIVRVASRDSRTAGLGVLSKSLKNFAASRRVARRPAIRRMMRFL